LEASTNRNRMSRMGSSEYPFNLNYQLEGIAVGLLHRYRRVSFSRKGVEGLQRVFPDDMGFDLQ
jgi:hypothetical protein